MLKWFLFVLIALQAANAATIAVLEIVSVDDEVELTIHETRFLTDELRRQAAGILTKDYSIMSRDQLIASLSGTKDDFTSSGYMEIGKALKSDYIIYGSVGKLGTLLTLNIALYETNSGTLFGEIVGESPDLKGLLETIREKSPNLFAKLKKDETENAKAEPPAEQIKIAEPAKEETKSIPANVPAEPKKNSNSLWIAVGLDVLGAAALGLGIYQNSQMTKYYNEAADLKKEGKEYKGTYKKAQDANSLRNILYATSGALLLSGIAVHIWF
jgi:NADH dehydrogenase/NADH:ubiquinone oxidoreductase subunit G